MYKESKMDITGELIDVLMDPESFPLEEEQDTNGHGSALVSQEDQGNKVGQVPSFLSPIWRAGVPQVHTLFSGLGLGLWGRLGCPVLSQQPIFSGSQQPMLEGPVLERQEGPVLERQVALRKAAERFKNIFQSKLIHPLLGSGIDPSFRGFELGDSTFFFSPDVLSQVYTIMSKMFLTIASGSQPNFKAVTGELAILNGKVSEPSVSEAFLSTGSHFLPDRQGSARTTIAPQDFLRLAFSFVLDRQIPKSLDSFVAPADQRSEVVTGDRHLEDSLPGETVLDEKKLKEALGTLIGGIMSSAEEEENQEMAAYRKEFPDAMAWIDGVSKMSEDSSIREKYFSGTDAECRRQLIILEQHLPEETSLPQYPMYKLEPEEVFNDAMFKRSSLNDRIDLENQLSGFSEIDTSLFTEEAGPMVDQIKQYPYGADAIFEELSEVWISGGEDEFVAKIQQYFDSENSVFEQEELVAKDRQERAFYLEDESEISSQGSDSESLTPEEKALDLRADLVTELYGTELGLDLTSLVSEEERVMKQFAEYPQGAILILNDLLNHIPEFGVEGFVQKFEGYFNKDGFKPEVLVQAESRVLEYQRSVFVNFELADGKMISIPSATYNWIESQQVMDLLGGGEHFNLFINSPRVLEAAADYPRAMEKAFQEIFSVVEGSRIALFDMVFGCMEGADGLTYVVKNRRDLAKTQCIFELDEGKFNEYLLNDSKTLIKAPKLSDGLTRRVAQIIRAQEPESKVFFESDQCWTMWSQYPLAMTHIMAQIRVSRSPLAQFKKYFSGNSEIIESIVIKLDAQLKSEYFPNHVEVESDRDAADERIMAWRDEVMESSSRPDLNDGKRIGTSIQSEGSAFRNVASSAPDASSDYRW